MEWPQAGPALSSGTLNTTTAGKVEVPGCAAVAIHKQQIASASLGAHIAGAALICLSHMYNVQKI